MPSRLIVVLLSLMLALPVVVFWLWLVIVPARVAILCPEECLCEIVGRNVECEDTSLTAVPLILLTDVRGFWFSENKVKVLVKDRLVSLTELEELYVDGSELKNVELGAFNGLTKLTELTIQRTEISEIIPGTFECIINLEVRSLRRKKKEHVDRNMFSGLFKLKYIDLTENKLQYVHPDAFLRLPKFQKIDLYENPGLHIPTDRNFIKSPSLTRLDISSCNISSVSVETFANVRALEWLDLSYNKLRTVDINILKALPKLSSLQLYGNPLHCDCQLQEVWQWCEDRNMWTVFGKKAPKCETPKEVKRMGWWVLENGKCLEGNVQFYGDHNNTRYNYTESNYDYDLHFLNRYELPVYTVSFIFGTTGNVIVLIIIICNKDMRTVPNMYIINLAVSDIIYLTELLAEAYANLISDAWQRNDNIMCTFLPFCHRVSVCLSAYFVALLSIQRYRVIVNAFHVRVSSKPSWRGTVATIIGVWIAAALIAVPSTVTRYQCAKNASMTPTTYYQHVVIFELLASFVLPLCVIAFTYNMTARHLVESSPSISEGTENPQLKTRRITAKILVGLTVVFLISYLPYHVLLTYIIWTQGNDAYPSIRVMILYWNNGMSNLILTFFLSINSCLNPVALFCTSSPIRQHFKRYLTCFRKTNSSSTELQPTRKN